MGSTDEHPKLTDEEIRQVKALILADNRRQWVISGIKGVSVWVAAIAGGYLALKGVLIDLVGGLK